MTDEQIENLLRKAPQRSAPSGLLARLQADIHLPKSRHAVSASSDLSIWLRRWVPGLGFAVIALSSVIVLAIQTYTLTELREQNAALKAELAEREQAEQNQAGVVNPASDAQALEWLRKDNEELHRLRDEVTRLRALLPELQRLRLENQQLASGSTAAPEQEGNPEFFARVPSMADIVEGKRKSIACVNNLKNIGLAARVFNTDHNVYPKTFLEMADDLATPKVLFCPADTNRTEARDFAELTSANVTYELLSPDASEKEPDVVYARCPVHGHVVMADGSVMQGGPGREVQLKDGKWIVKQPSLQ